MQGSSSIAPQPAASGLKSTFQAWKKTLFTKSLPPLEPILHPSAHRIFCLGLAAFLGHPVFGFVWSHWLVQPYENIPARICMSLLGLILMWPKVSFHPTGLLTAIGFTVASWIQLPVFFTWMYLCNSGNAVWLASVGAMILILYHITDWRLATVGLVLGSAVAWVLFVLFGPNVPAIEGELLATNCMVIGFCWSMGLLLGGFSANARQAQLEHNRSKQKALISLAASIAHEVRNSFASIQHSLEGMTHALPAPSTTQGVFQLDAGKVGKLYQCVTRGQIAIDRGLQIIAMTLNEVADKALDPKQFEYLSAHASTQKALDEYHFAHSEERAKVSLVVKQDFSFKVDETAYFFVLFNLLKNAIYYFAQYPQARVSITIDAPCVCVRDSGPGIPPELLPRLFQAFASSGKSSGTGLGLAYCKRVMRAFGGDIACESQAGLFTEFTLRFVPASASELAAHEEQLLQAASRALRNKRVLLVEDQVLARKTTSDWLQHMGLHTDAVADGLSALTRLSQQDYDLVLTDLQMPQMDGYALAQNIRQGAVPGRTHVALLAYSSEPASTASIKTAKVGMDGFVNKTCSKVALLQALQKALAQAQQRSQMVIQVHVLREKTVLVVDDSAQNRQIVQALLEPLGVHCLHADSGYGVLHLLAKGHKVDAILMDMSMPGLSGQETTQAIRAQNQTMPIVALTANSGQAHMNAALQAGMNDFLSKPVNATSLQKVLCQLLANEAVAPQPSPAPVPPPSPLHTQQMQQTQQPHTPIQQPNPLPDTELQARAACSAQGVALLNVAYLDSLRQVSHHLLIETQQAYLAQMQTALSHEIPQCIKQRDMSDLQDVMHRFLGDAANSGCLALHRYTKNLYESIHEGRWPAIDNWLPQLRELFEQTRSAIHQSYLAPYYLDQYVPEQAG